MIPGFTIELDRDKIPLELLLRADSLLPQVVRNLHEGIAFAGLVNGSVIGACIMVEKKHYFDIVNLSIEAAWQRKGFGKEMLLHALDYARAHGGRYVETGAGNARLDLLTMYQRMGFRVVAVWKDYYLSDNEVVAYGIHNRDMLRFRIDLLERERRARAEESNPPAV